MQRFFSKTVVLLFAVLSAAVVSGEVFRTGEQVSALPSPQFIDGSTHTLKDFFKDRYVVIFMWEMNPAALNDFSQIANIAAVNKDIAEFVGIGIGNYEQLKRFPGAGRLGFPVNADNGDAELLFRRDNDPMPLNIVLDKSGRILWRGSTRQLPKVLQDCREGKLDLKEQIRLEEFTNTVNNAIKEEKLDIALAMLRAEWDRYPSKTELVTAQITLLKRLDRIADAFALVREAQGKLPTDYKVYEMEYQLIATSEESERLTDFFERLKAAFAEKPEVIIAFAVAEFRLPPEKLEIGYVFDLARFGWEKQAFKTPYARGMYAMEYARIMHSVGRNDLAAKLAKEACADLEGHEEMLAKARTAEIFYTKLDAIDDSLSVTHLKNQ